MKLQTKLLIAIFSAVISFNAVGEVNPQPTSTSEYFGVPLTPGIYLTNFELLYTLNPSVAANLPAYMAPIPDELVACLKNNNLTGCPYNDYKKYLNNPSNNIDAATSTKCIWGDDCKISPILQRLAPPRYHTTKQINQPLGQSKATKIAKALRLDKKMILTESEYQCFLGNEATRTDDQKIINQCVANLTNSRGNAKIPLSSYGLSLVTVNNEQYLQTDCADGAPCLEFNNLLAGPLERLAFKCGFFKKLTRMVTRTPFIRVAFNGVNCQNLSISGCIAEATIITK